MRFRFTPSLESLDERLNLSPVLPTAGRITGVAVDPATEPVRQISIVVDPPAPDVWVNVWVTGTELPDASGVSVVLRRLANPSVPDDRDGATGTHAGTHALYQDVVIPSSTRDSYYGTGVYRSVDSGRTW